MRSIISVSRFVCTLKNYINNSKIDLAESLLNQRMAAATRKNRTSRNIKWKRTHIAANQVVVTVPHDCCFIYRHQIIMYMAQEF